MATSDPSSRPFSAVRGWDAAEDGVTSPAAVPAEVPSRPFAASGGWDTPTTEPVPGEPPQPQETTEPPEPNESWSSSGVDEPQSSDVIAPDVDREPAEAPDSGAHARQAGARTADSSKGRKAVVVAAAVIAMFVVGGAALVAFFFGGETAEPADDGVAVAAIGSVPAPVETTTPRDGPSMWRQPAWADTVAGMTAFELAANGDVSFANGRIRPTLGISCTDGDAEVHMTTGGTAIIDPQTSGHMVRLRFDGSPEQVQQWTASDDQRTLFATDPRGVADHFATANTLEVGYTHYLTGPVTVNFDLWGGDEVVRSMAESCSWAE